MATTEFCQRKHDRKFFLHACTNILARIKDRKSEMKQGNIKMKQTEAQVKGRVVEAQ